MHIHRFGKWEDVALGVKHETAVGLPFVLSTQVITQQRRCSTCNLVKTRIS